jgi:lactam utilization protein B
MRQGFRKLPWRLKLKWALLAFVAFLVVNAIMVSAVKKHGGLFNSKAIKDQKVKKDSILRLQKKVDSLIFIIKHPDTLHVKNIQTKVKPAAEHKKRRRHLRSSTVKARHCCCCNY